jgi:hypothetical protein
LVSANRAPARKAPSYNPQVRNILNGVSKIF